MALGIGTVAEAGTWTRRTYLVDRNFQLRYAILTAVAAALVAVPLGLWLRESHALAMASGALSYAALKLSEANFRFLFTLFVGVAALAVVGMGAVGVRLSHRVAGPAMLMRRHLTALAQGRYPSIRPLRKRDELNELFVTMANAVEQVRRRDVDQLELIEESLDVMTGAVGRVPELVPVIARLQAAAEDRRAALDLAAAATGAAAKKG